MIVSKSENRTFSASIEINKENIASLSAVYNSNNRLNFAENILNVDSYKENKEIVDEEIVEWKQEITNKIFSDNGQSEE